MKLMPVCSYNTRFVRSVSFGSTDRFYKTESGKEIGNNTWLFRDDLDWRAFVDFQIRHFLGKENVNIIQFASSDGSEGYTHIMALLENSKRKNVDKFFPIQAYDIDNFMVKKAKSGQIRLLQKDIEGLRNNFINPSVYFERQPFPFNLPEQTLKQIQHNPYQILTTNDTFKVSNVLTDKISFNQGNMFNILPKIKDNSNTIIMCRNILGYFHEEPNIVEGFIEDASKVLKTGSLFVIGKLDTDLLKIEGILNKNSFIKVMRNVYMKV